MSGAPAIGLALGGGSARGLAHIPVLEAFDELGLRPATIAGTSAGAIMGAAYASGLSAAEIRAHAEELLAKRSVIAKRIAKSYEGLVNLWSPRAPSVVDGVTLYELLMPESMRCDFHSLKIPLTVVATDYYAMEEVRIEHGPVIPAVAASCTLPTVFRPVVLGGRVLVDGGFVNPIPFDIVRPKVDITIAVDVSGATRIDGDTAIPSPMEAWIGSFQILFRSVTREKLKTIAPDIFLHPEVGTFGAFDFMRFKEIFAASAPAKDELKRMLDSVISNRGC
jgi:NTE family protein